MHRPQPRPKRGGEEFTRFMHATSNSDGPSSSKKPRFDLRNPSTLAPDAPEDDVVLDADDIGRRGQQTKRNAVNIDGYESDSSNEGFDSRPEARAKEIEDAKGKAKSRIEEQDDMFADLEDDFQDDAESERRHMKKKAMRFLDDSEIEGQVESSKSGGHVSSNLHLDPNAPETNEDEESGSGSSSESDVADEVRADVGEMDEEIGAGGKKLHAPKLDAFNMRQEQEEGRFDEQGNYVRKAADPDAVYDSWLEGVSKKDMKKAKEAHDKREMEQRQKAVANDRILTSDLLATLIRHLQRGETVLEILARLNKTKEKKPKWQNKAKNRRNRPSGMQVEERKTIEDPAEVRRRELVEAITEAADQLMSRGEAEIYDEERELLLRKYKRETGEEWVDVPATVDHSDDVPSGKSQVPEAIKQWEYRWSDQRDGGETHGPYDGPTMVSWNQAGYFGDGVEFRRAATSDEWSRSVDFV